MVRNALSRVVCCATTAARRGCRLSSRRLSGRRHPMHLPAVDAAASSALRNPHLDSRTVRSISDACPGEKGVWNVPYITNMGSSPR